MFMMTKKIMDWIPRNSTAAIRTSSVRPAMIRTIKFKPGRLFTGYALDVTMKPQRGTSQRDRTCAMTVIGRTPGRQKNMK